MYLKSLVLKGFKSFADRSVLSMQPGITAIVGPNGSGKSNISDAVLWVLGERSARNLRGQAMDDIIFAGSAARKAVSVAEVELVLDNSDHVLPVDFDEVAITRRMYRSGESEYLVNGVIARRLDVLDILHDSGLGTGTHSIISQGSLDSILQSRPEDRRSLIEEAAGILKHKRRKEKSERKLELMQNNLDRVRDVTAEVGRQLAPLERKAKRAEAYKKATGELAEVKLALAVDDLRNLQKQWDEICSQEQLASTEVDAKREAVEVAERAVNDYQELMRRTSEDAGVVARRQRRASNLGERLDSAEMLVRERCRAARASCADLEDSLGSSQRRRADASAELASSKEQLAEVAQLSERADAKVSELQAQRKEIDKKRRALEDTIHRLSRTLSSCERDLEKAHRQQSTLKESLASGMAQVKIVEARRQEFENDLARARENHEACSKALASASEALEDLASKDTRAREELAALFKKRDHAHSERDEAQKATRLAQTEKEAVEKALRASHADDPALGWLIEHAHEFEGALSAVSKAFKVSRGLESLVERMLGADLAALSVDDADCAQRVVEALVEGNRPGDVGMVLRADVSGNEGLRYEGSIGHALMDELTYSDESRPIVEALLGDVVLCDTAREAFAAHRDQAGPWRYVSQDGCVIWPSGKVVVLGAADEHFEGVIARERRLDELAVEIEGLATKQLEAEKASEAADEAYRVMQTQSLELSQQLANSKGAHASARTDEERAARRVQEVMRDIAHAEKQMAAATQEVEGLQPSLDELAERIDELERTRAESLQERRSCNEEVAPLRKRAVELDEQLTEARLSAAKLAERKTYVERLVLARKRDVETIERDAMDARGAIAVKKASIVRAEGLLDVLKDLSTRLGRRIRVLDEALSESESSTNSVHAGVAEARDKARHAHDAYDTASARAAQVRVDKGRLEMRVEAAVNVIVRDLGMPLDRAQELPALEDRQIAEDESFRLERRIKNMGAVNPDAAEEYAKLKERYDFLAGQLSDMESARKSLGRIVRVIDARMKDDFVRTFEEVNSNFSDIFGMLFPGGTAHLSFDDPDDIENTGVEVTAQPAGKRLTKMMLMSGGEKSLTALALLFAVYKTRATPFYILDEVEAALDDTNLRRLAGYIDSLRNETQLIMITHQRRTMEMADVLFGVSMHADGVTKVISQKLERALEHAE